MGVEVHPCLRRVEVDELHHLGTNALVGHATGAFFATDKVAKPGTGVVFPLSNELAPLVKLLLERGVVRVVHESNKHTVVVLVVVCEPLVHVFVHACLDCDLVAIELVSVVLHLVNGLVEVVPDVAAIIGTKFQLDPRGELGERL